MLASERLREFLVHNPSDKEYGTPAKVCASIVEEVEGWLERYRERGAAWYNDEWQNSKAMRELSQLERLAAGKMDYYLGGRGWINEVPMEQVARYAEAEIIMRLDEMAARSRVGGGEGREGADADADSEARRRELALELCRRRGVLIKSADETNDLGEPPLVASGARGDVENLGPLLMAGCKLESATESGGLTGLHMACMMGHVEYSRRLADEGADLLRRGDDEGRTGLYYAAERGHLGVVKLMLEKGGKELGMIVDKWGKSCAFAAAEKGHIDVLRFLYEVCGKELLMLVRENGASCAYVAARDGRIDVLRWLHEACGKELLMLVHKDGWSCALVAAQKGDVDALRFLYEVCGKELLMLVNKAGATCTFLAAENGHVDALRWLCEVGGKELLMLSADRGGGALAAAIGNKDACMLLARLGGLEFVSVKDAGGWTVFHKLAFIGGDALRLANEIASVSQGEALLHVARKEVAEYDAAVQGGVRGGFVVHRCFPSTLKMDQVDQTVEFHGVFTTLRSTRMCPGGSRGYFELEIISMPSTPQFGFATEEFAAIRGNWGDGVGDDSFSWAVDGARELKWHGGAGEWECGWRDGDVIGFACDLVEGKLHVSLNGEFSEPNGCVFEIDVAECTGLFAAFTADGGKVRYNLGEAAFKHVAPPGSDYTAFHDFPPWPPQDRDTSLHYRNGFPTL
jgi:ankyrin repeat protein